MKDFSKRMGIFITAFVIVGMSAGCSRSIGTDVTVVPNPAKPPTGTTGTGMKLACDPKLESLSINRDSDSWQGIDIGFLADGVVSGEGDDETFTQLSVDVTVYGDIPAETAIVHFEQFNYSASGRFDYEYPPVAVTWPYDAKGVRVTFNGGDFGYADIDRVDLCVKPS